MSTLQKISKKNLYILIRSLSLQTAALNDSRIFSTGNAGVQGNEQADNLAGDAAIDNNLTLDPPTVIQ